MLDSFEEDKRDALLEVGSLFGVVSRSILPLPVLFPVGTAAPGPETEVW